jgi:molybdopterin molybdotransferase
VTAAPTARVAPVTAGRRSRQRGGLPWPDARRRASQAEPLTAVRVPLGDALGLVLAADLRALGDLPASDNSAMDGWAVAGAPPWRVMADLPAGRVHPNRLRSGQCVRIATGAAVPSGAAAVLPVEESVRDRTGVRPLACEPEVAAGSHIRRAGEEARPGDVLLRAGTPVTPPVLGLAAATGHDSLLVVPSAVVDVLVLGDELLASGVAGPGRTRDALGPQLPGWLAALGAPVRSVSRLPDDPDRLAAAIRASNADVVLTTGGTSVGEGDHLHAALARLGARLVVDGVDVKPGHPMVLAALPGGRWLVGLPGNPLAACSALLTLAGPLLRALHARQQPEPVTVRLAAAAPGRPGDGHRLLPVARGATGVGVEQPSCGSAMLRGLAGASGLAVVPPVGVPAGAPVPYLELPWSSR